MNLPDDMPESTTQVAGPGRGLGDVRAEAQS